jgi:hypothetical protein
MYRIVILILIHHRHEPIDSINLLGSQRRRNVFPVRYEQTYRVDLYYGWVHPVAHVTMNKYNNRILFYLLFNLQLHVSSRNYRRIYICFNSIDVSNR